MTIFFRCCASVSACARFHHATQACERMIALGPYLFLCGGSKWTAEHARLVTALACDPQLQALDRKVAAMEEGVTTASSSASAPALTDSSGEGEGVAVDSKAEDAEKSVALARPVPSASAIVDEARIQLQDSIVAHVLQVGVSCGVWM